MVNLPWPSMTGARVQRSLLTVPRLRLVDAMTLEYQFQVSMDAANANDEDNPIDRDITRQSFEDNDSVRVTYLVPPRGLLHLVPLLTRTFATG
ncbi:hypothetical protein IMZ48_37810 [Candidatus Bathyarchaeota archaeon]|nr:hypothetical protein [Candidatus Bathyarchaeota archaeon]